MPGGIYLKFEVEGQSLKRLNGALKALAADDAPYLKGAMEDIGRLLELWRDRLAGSIFRGPIPSTPSQIPCP